MTALPAPASRAGLIAEQFRILHLALETWDEWSIEPVEQAEHRKALDALRMLERLVKEQT